ncbi:hypothetical protein QW131_13695 [Roseibium salinum]|nr:hypothetical protein [Roseibium salinum]
MDITWKDLQLGFYGKGTPDRMRRILTVIDFYLKTADINLGRVHWNYVMGLQDYAKWYLGLDCNGFTGAYLESQYPSLGINGGDHINYLDGKLKKRAGVADVRAGDILSREGSGGTRHVSMVNSVSGMIGPGATSAQVSITQSASSLGGLNTKNLHAEDDRRGAEGQAAEMGTGGLLQVPPLPGAGAEIGCNPDRDATGRLAKAGTIPWCAFRLTLG